MLRRLLPFLMIFLAVMLDTAVMPVLYYGDLSIPFTLTVVLAISLTLGKLRGMLFGLIGGLMIDITCGTLGMMSFFFLAAGLLMGLILDERGSVQSIRKIVLHARRWIVSFVLFVLGETVFCVYDYFNTASFEWFLVTNILIRTLLFATAATLLIPFYSRLFLGKKDSHQASYSRTREVKHF